MKKNKEILTESDLVSFGNYLLSKKRNESILNSENKRWVGDWDLANWKYYKEKSALDAIIEEKL
jgi:hypothetical protein